jgi:ATPase subunit of ABC transporter with duplicated ATPase domains
MLSFVMHHGREPLVLDQPEDDLDTEWITQLVVKQLRSSRWTRQLIVVTHNANIPVNADAERVIVLENHDGAIRVRETRDPSGGRVAHIGALEQPPVRRDIQQIMEGGVAAFVRREKRYNNELNTYRAALKAVMEGEDPPDRT